MHIGGEHLPLIKAFHPILERISASMQHLAQRRLNIARLSAVVLKADRGDLPAVQCAFHSDIADAACAVCAAFRVIFKEAQPVDAAAVLESAVNAFIVVNSKSSGVFSRDTEVHMPTYKPTGFAVVSGNTFTEAEPYKYFVSKGTGMKDNYMMWALMIPGEFRYPAERKDIRTAYTYFNAWAASGGAQHVDWYEDEADEDMLY